MRGFGAPEIGQKERTAEARGELGRQSGRPPRDEWWGMVDHEAEPPLRLQRVPPFPTATGHPYGGRWSATHPAVADHFARPTPLLPSPSSPFDQFWVSQIRATAIHPPQAQSSISHPSRHSHPSAIDSSHILSQSFKCSSQHSSCGFDGHGLS